MSRGKLVEFLKSKLMVGSLSVPTYSGHRTIGDMIEVEVINELSQNYNSLKVRVNEVSMTLVLVMIYMMLKLTTKMKVGSLCRILFQLND